MINKPMQIPMGGKRSTRVPLLRAVACPAVGQGRAVGRSPYADWMHGMGTTRTHLRKIVLG
jgi:hypothetical protein